MAEISEKKTMERWLLERAIVVVGTLFSAFHLYATMSGVVSVMIQRELHVGFAITLGVLVLWKKALDKGGIGVWGRALNLAVITAVVVTTVYLVLIDDELFFHIGAPSQLEITLGAVIIVCLLWITRCTMGNIMPAIAVVAILYALFGQYMPAGLAHKGYDMERLASYLFLSEDGIYGVPAGTSATVVIMFILFGSFLQSSGAEIVFRDGAFALFGRVRGGPAKVAVVTSALFGTINGSAIANVVTTGTFTIPLMKGVGYSPHFAGAVEAVASTGGQIMPPIMGAAAFIMAQVLGVSYAKVALAAIIPSLLYFYMCFLVVDLQALKRGMKGMNASELPSLKVVGKEGWHIVLTLAALLYFLLVVRLTPNKTALYCSGLCVALTWLTKNHKMTLRKIIESLVDAAEGVIAVALACSTAGIVIGVLGLTGLGLKMSSLLVIWSGGHLIILMILTMITGIILGMGLPTTGVYIILSVLAAPALINMGVKPLSAHFFVFYYGVLAAITPPVALASYAGAGIAGAGYMKTSWTAVKLGAAGFLMPFIFVFGPAILLDGTPLEIIHVSFTALVGITALAFAIQGFPRGRRLLRLVLFVSSLLLLDPGTLTDVIGCSLILAVWLLCRFLPAVKVETVGMDED